MKKMYYVLVEWNGLWVTATEHPYDSAAKALQAAQNEGLTQFKIEYTAGLPSVF